jgi:hypothetical protein
MFNSDIIHSIIKCQCLTDLHIFYKQLANVGFSWINEYRKTYTYLVIHSGPIVKHTIRKSITKPENDTYVVLQNIGFTGSNKIIRIEVYDKETEKIERIKS